MLWGSLLGILPWPLSQRLLMCAGRCEPLTEGAGFMNLYQMQYSAFIWKTFSQWLSYLTYSWRSCIVQDIQGCRGLGGESRGVITA